MPKDLKRKKQKVCVFTSFVITFDSQDIRKQERGFRILNNTPADEYDRVSPTTGFPGPARPSGPSTSGFPGSSAATLHDQSGSNRSGSSTSVLPVPPPAGSPSKHSYTKSLASYVNDGYVPGSSEDSSSQKEVFNPILSPQTSFQFSGALGWRQLIACNLPKQRCAFTRKRIYGYASSSRESRYYQFGNKNLWQSWVLTILDEGLLIFCAAVFWKMLFFRLSVDRLQKKYMTEQKPRVLPIFSLVRTAEDKVLSKNSKKRIWSLETQVVGERTNHRRAPLEHQMRHISQLLSAVSQSMIPWLEVQVVQVPAFLNRLIWLRTQETKRWTVSVLLMTNRRILLQRLVLNHLGSQKQFFSKNAKNFSIFITNFGISGASFCYFATIWCFASELDSQSKRTFEY